MQHVHQPDDSNSCQNDCGLISLQKPQISQKGRLKKSRLKNTLCLKQSSRIRSLTTTLKLPKDTLFVKSASTFHNKSSCSMVLPSGLRIPWHLHLPMINSTKILFWVKLCKPFRNKLTFRRTWQLVSG